jgi:hypothetical protein
MRLAASPDGSIDGAKDTSLAIRLAFSPLAWIVAFGLGVLLCLLLPLRLPLGANYWDTAIYLDAAQRISVGQMPSVDFPAPVGPLGYYLAALGLKLFPQAPAMLVVQWCMLALTLPLIAVIAGHVRSRASDRHGGSWSGNATALALTLPFLLFSLFPMNLHDFYPLPGFDGYGFYNRHASLLLYLLVASIAFVSSSRLQILLLTALMLALFLTKITGAVAGSLMIGYAVLAGRLSPRDVVIAALGALGVLGLIELATGMISAYLGTILVLLQLNNDTLLRRILTVASVKFNVVAPVLALLGVLAWAAWRSSRERDGGRRLASVVLGLARAPAGLLAATLAALAVFETQNTGSLEFLGIWPALLLLLIDWSRRQETSRGLVMALIAASAIPSAIILVERSARAVLSAPSYTTLDLPDLRALGRVLAKPDIAQRGATMLEHYARHPEPYRQLAAGDVLPSYILFSEFDFQVTWLLSVQEAVVALRAYEAANKVRFASLYTLDFTDPFNWLLDRRPPKYVQIGLDPGRTTQAPDDRLFAELNSVDAILVPLCPITASRMAIAATFGTDLERRRSVRLSPCWEMRLRG